MPIHRRDDFLIPTLAVVFDSIAIEFSFLFSYWLRFETTLLNFLPLTEDKPPLDAYIYGSFFVIPIWLLIFNSRKMYRPRRNVSLSDDFFLIVRLVTLGMLVVMSGAFFYRAFSYSRIVFGLLWITSIVTITIDRFIILQIEKYIYSHGKGLHNAILIGCNELTKKIFDALDRQPLLGYKILGYIADQPNNKLLGEIKYLGEYKDIPEIIKSHQVELVLCTLSSEEHSQLYKIIQDTEGMRIEFLMVPDVVESMMNTMTLKEIGGIPFLKLKGLPMTTWGRIIKRTFDIVVSLVLLVLCSWLLIIIALLVKLSSKGPIFYKQERISLDGVKFQIIKFRSMRVDAESQTGPVWAKSNDDRATFIGRFLRKTSLDELPQLINVLKGEMSLVGPRPERPYFVEKFKDLIPQYLDRHRVKTGMTGWAQVNGFRGDSSLEERIKYDIYYIENWSFIFDLKILFKTILTMIQRKSN